MEDDISHLYIALSNRTRLDIPNQRDDTSLHQDNDSSKLIPIANKKKKLFKLNNTPFFYFSIPSGSFENLILDCQSPQEILLYRVHCLST
jgi:hypothetical protein